MVFTLRASLSAVQICSWQICRFCRGFFEGASQPLRKTRGIPAAPLWAILDKSCDARGGMKGLKNHAFGIFFHFALFAIVSLPGGLFNPL